MSSEMERSRSDFGINLWVGSTGCSGDLNRNQAEALLINKPEWTPTSETETRRQLALLNMKQFQCAIVQINDPNGEPISNPLIYALLFNQLTTVNYWVCSGEFNKDEIFHVHVMLQTPSRSDSLRRSFYTVMTNLNISTNFQEIFGQQCTFECLKIERTHKPESMLAYLLKAPLWVCGNREHILQLSFDVHNLDLPARFRPQEQEQQTIPEMNPMTEEIIGAIIEGGAKTMEDLVRTHPGVIAKYLHRVGLDTIIRNCLMYVKATGNEWTLEMYSKEDPDPRAIHRVLLHQGIEPSKFDDIFYTWLTKKDSKKNTICLYGPSNTGKSAFISGLKQLLPWGECVNTATFTFEGLIDSTIGVWEEPLISPEVAEKAKQIFEGMITSIPIKFKKPFKLPRTPIIITTNHYPWRFCSQEEPMFRNRMWIIDWIHPVKDSPYICRTTEHSCECGHCRASRGSTSPPSTTEPSEMSRREQSFPTREESLRSTYEINVGSGSMYDPREGTSRSDYSSRRCSSSSTSEQCSDSTRSALGSSPTIERFLGYGSNKSGHTGIRIHSAESQCPEQLESDDSDGNIRHDSSGNGSSGSREQFKRKHSGRDGHFRTEHHSLSTMVGMGTSKENKMQISIQPKKRKLDRKVGSIKHNPYNIPLYVPDKQAWKGYLAYLYCYYG
ncbi:NS1 protein [avian chapparvovirus BR_DF10]|uniref:NS1 protein n=1 Tax=avian chapparvovirus BR_DF10 TaxID=3070175 RepID=A0A5C0PVF5_9VIRU|nr:NS1 protein [Avian chapparvovirus]QEJ80802.1 NS1 protein [avian chapparvovirus BR_DF10]